MKTPKKVTHLNFYDIAFFNEVSTTQAKEEMAVHIYGNWDSVEFSKTGVPKIKVSDLVEKKHFESKIKSSSILEGVNRIDYLIHIYNNEIPLNTILQLSDNPVYIKSLKFTGIRSILNDILNDEQLLIVKKRWLTHNVYGKKYWSEKTIDFIEINKWAIDFIEKKGINRDKFYEEKARIIKQKKL